MLNEALYIINGLLDTLHVHHLTYETNHFSYTLGADPDIFSRGGGSNLDV